MAQLSKKQVQNYLAHFPEKISKELEEYAVSEAFKKSRYLFVYRKGKQQYGYCTHCNKEIETHGLKHNEKATCKLCNSDCIAKQAGRGRKNLYDGAYFIFYEKSVIDPEVIVARGIYAERNYSGSYKNVKTNFEVEAWYIFDIKNGNVMLKKPSWWCSNRLPELKKSVYSNFSYYDKSWIKYVGYSMKSIKNAVKDTPFRWSCWEQYSSDGMVKFFDLYSKYPCIEYLTKLGFSNLVKDKLYGERTYSSINWKGKTLFKVLKLTKQELNEIKSKRINVTFWFLNLFHKNKNENLGFSTKEIYEISIIYNDYYMEKLESMLGYGSIKEITKYLSKQASKNHKHYFDSTSALRDWKDYIEDCKKLEMDLSKKKVIFPSNLYKAHQNTIKQVKVKADEMLNKEIKKRLKSLEKYRFEYQGLIIRPVISTNELIAEGKALHHCVGTYADKYAKGETNILVIRNASESAKPFFTVELRQNRIIQVRGKNNCNPDETVSNFIEAYKREKLNKKKAKSEAKIRIPA